MKGTMDDIIMCALIPDLKFPKYCAVNLSHVPPVDVSHCDMSVVLKELQSLRAEVRNVQNLSEEVISLQSLISKYPDGKGVKIIG